MSKNQDPLLDTKRWVIGGSALLIALFLASLFINGTINDVINKKEPVETFYDTGNPNDMTEKEMKEYLEWQNEQDQKEKENQKVFN